MKMVSMLLGHESRLYWAGNMDHSLLFLAALFSNIFIIFTTTPLLVSPGCAHSSISKATQNTIEANRIFAVMLITVRRSPLPFFVYSCRLSDACLANKEAAPQKLIAKPLKTNESAHEASLSFIIFRDSPNNPKNQLHIRVSMGISGCLSFCDMMSANRCPMYAPSTANNVEMTS
mmetsp:Transcript_1636/g.3508  ORF Transcript_1636/g.3508 Transcript_1636/m.3508 type:complete len:175 (+) Transcript_1636:68-592(+)